MIVPFAIKKPFAGMLFPLDYYRFRHTHESVQDPQQNRVVARPLWIVGTSPFDQVISEDCGFIVHLGVPQFTARWTMNDDTIRQISVFDFYDEDLNIMIYETILMNNNGERLHEWLVEAVCAVAYSKGTIAVASSEETH